MHNWVEPLKKSDYLHVKNLLQNGADVNSVNDAGESVLMYALRSYCHFDLIMLLIDNGADIFAVDDEGVSVFDMAVTYSNISMVKYILDQGIDVNKTQRKSGFTSLMCAACYGRNEVVKILLENGADKNITDAKGFNATDFARKMQKKSILKLLEYDENAPKNTIYAR
jgi:ankyrin repeat protein